MDLRSLIAEKESIMEKIQKLENIKDDIREAVYNKIKTEYNENLQRVESAIRENQSGIEEEIESIKTEIAEVMELQEKYESEYEEIKVRIQLGEYSEEDHENKINELKEQIETYRKRHNELNEKIDELNSLTEIDKVQTTSIEKEEDEPVPDIIEDSPVMKEEISQGIDDEFEQSIEQSLDETLPDLNTDESAVIESADDDFTKSMLPDEHETDTDVSSEGQDASIDEEAPQDPINDILQPVLDTDDDTDDSGIETISNDMDGFLEDAESEEQQSAIDGIECPKCHHVNNPNLMNCEKCGAELF